MPTGSARRAWRWSGPGADGARLEGSKAFMKEVLDEAGVRTARYGVFSDLEGARSFLATLPGPFVVKTDGLAAGKGVLVAATRGGGRGGHRRQALRALPSARPAAAWWSRRAWPVSSAPSRRCATVGGPSRWPRPGTSSALSTATGAPTRGAWAATRRRRRWTTDLVGRVMDQAVEPVVAALLRRGIDFRGVLYAGIMVTDDGPAVLEFNVRFGDPEAQVVLPRLADDPVALLRSVALGALSGPPRFSAEAAVCVVAAAAGYPEAPEDGARIEGLGPDGQLADPVARGDRPARGHRPGQRRRLLCRRRPGARVLRARPDARRSPDPGVRGGRAGPVAGHAAARPTSDASSAAAAVVR